MFKILFCLVLISGSAWAGKKEKRAYDTVMTADTAPAKAVSSIPEAAQYVLDRPLMQNSEKEAFLERAVNVYMTALKVDSPVNRNVLHAGRDAIQNGYRFAHRQGGYLSTEAGSSWTVTGDGYCRHTVDGGVYLDGDVRLDDGLVMAFGLNLDQAKAVYPAWKATKDAAEPIIRQEVSFGKADPQYFSLGVPGAVIRPGGSTGPVMVITVDDASGLKSVITFGFDADGSVARYLLQPDDHMICGNFSTPDADGFYRFDGEKAKSYVQALINILGCGNADAMVGQLKYARDTIYPQDTQVDTAGPVLYYIPTASGRRAHDTVMDSTVPPSIRLAYMTEAVGHVQYLDAGKVQAVELDGLHSAFNEMRQRCSRLEFCAADMSPAVQNHLERVRKTSQAFNGGYREHYSRVLQSGGVEGTRFNFVGAGGIQPALAFPEQEIFMVGGLASPPFVLAPVGTADEVQPDLRAFQGVQQGKYQVAIEGESEVAWRTRVLKAQRDSGVDSLFISAVGVYKTGNCTPGALQLIGLSSGNTVIRFWTIKDGKITAADSLCPTGTYVGLDLLKKDVFGRTMMPHMFDEEAVEKMFYIVVKVRPELEKSAFVAAAKGAYTTVYGGGD